MIDWKLTPQDTIEYDERERWLVHTQGTGASAIVADDVEPYIGRWIAGMADLREAIKADLTALAHWTPEDWAERGRGGDPIARTINAARDIVDARFA